MALPRRRILFAHGAGAPSTSDWMEGWARRLATLGRVDRFDYPYMAAGRRRPDPLPRLIDAHRQAANGSSHEATEPPLVYAGKSMGGRIGCHLALEEAPAALVCFGYPLRAPSGKLRDEVLIALRCPILFLQGTRDPLAPLDLLANVRKRMKAPNELHIVEEGDHSLIATRTWCKRMGQTQDDVDARTLAAIEGFLARHAPTRRGAGRRGDA